MRKLLPLLAVLLVVLLGACSTVGTALLGGDISFTAPQLQSQLNRNFPRDYKKLGGLVSLSLLNPRLSLSGGGRLQLEFDLGIGTLGSQSRTPSGRFALQSGLRFNTQTLGLHLDRPEIVSVDVPSLGGAMNDNARSMLNNWLLDYAREEPVYRLDTSALGRLASRRIQRVDIDPGTVTLRLD